MGRQLTDAEARMAQTEAKAMASVRDIAADTARIKIARA